MNVASWLAGIVMIVIFSPVLEPDGSILGRVWMTNFGGALALATVTGAPAVVVRIAEEFNVTCPRELVMTTGMARMGLLEKEKQNHEHQLTQKITERVVCSG